MAEQQQAIEKRRVVIADIPRFVPHFEEPKPNQDKLAKEAKRVLGYSGLLLHTAGGELATALESLEIEILEPEAVFVYQRQLGRATLSKPVTFFDVSDSSASASADDDEEEGDDAPITRRSAYRNGRTDWLRIPIGQYVKAIPEFVIRKAIQLKRSLPQVQLFVEEFSKDPDPFLVAILHSSQHIEEYYIEVWEEPKFEGRFVKHL